MKSEASGDAGRVSVVEEESQTSQEERPGTHGSSMERSLSRLLDHHWTHHLLCDLGWWAQGHGTWDGPSKEKEPHNVSVGEVLRCLHDKGRAATFSGLGSLLETIDGSEGCHVTSHAEPLPGSEGGHVTGLGSLLETIDGSKGRHVTGLGSLLETIGRHVPGPLTLLQELVSGEDDGEGLEVTRVSLTDLPPADILLDEDTACDCLHLSGDHKTASWTFIRRGRPHSAQRFQFRPQALSAQSISAGRHYWDVEVGGSDAWRLGVCYPSIDREGGVQSVLGNNRKSWCLSRSHTRLSVIHDRRQTFLFGGITAPAVRVALDYPNGLLSFYELGASIRHLHTFTASFSEPLHAGVGVWRGCIKVSGGGGAGE